MSTQIQANKNNTFIINVLLFLTFDLMLLGAGVRAMDAGLTCPDWPMCFGKVVPEYHFGVYLEFIHRAIAGLLSVLFLIFTVRIYTNEYSNRLRGPILFSGLILLSQVIMGGLTVLKVLQAGIVTTHLSLATVFFLSLIYIKFQLAEPITHRVQPSKIYRNLLMISFVAVALQIIIGGLVASNYAGLACVDFPKCNGQWFPELVGSIGLQVIHRYTAYTLVLLMSLFFVVSMSESKKGRLSQRVKRKSFKVFLLLLSQVAVGIMNIKMLIPVWLTVTHLCLALLILKSLFELNLLHFAEESNPKT